jgi:hypothetical protein
MSKLMDYVYHSKVQNTIHVFSENSSVWVEKKEKIDKVIILTMCKENFASFICQLDILSTDNNHRMR